MCEILIIDDEEDICVLLNSFFKKMSVISSYENTLKTGLEAIKEKEPNWLILDNNLPDGLGWDSIDDILKIKPSLKIIKISANPLFENSLNSKNIFYLPKPINFTQIYNLIKS